MPREKAELPLFEYGTMRVTHHALVRERAEALRRRPGPKSTKPECFTIGHAWIEDPAREGGTICMVCHVVRWS
jgi:hypothetical protein